MIKDIAIYGFGGFGREVACLINAINRQKPTWNLVGFFDDGVETGTECKYGKVLGAMNCLNSWPDEINVVFSIGSGQVVKMLVDKVTNPRVKFPNLIAPNTFFFDRSEVEFGQGNIITFGCRLSTNIKLGSFNILNGCVSLGHDAEMGSFNVLFPETRISGMTQIGDNNFFGAKSFVAQMLKVPDNVKIGAGAILLKNPKEGNLYLGNPAKLIKL